MQEKSARIWGTVSQERHDKLRGWADELGLQFSQYVGLCTWLGAKQLQRSIAPEEAISADVLAKVMALYIKDQGLEIDLEQLKQLAKEADSDKAAVGGLLPE